MNIAVDDGKETKEMKKRKERNFSMGKLTTNNNNARCMKKFSGSDSHSLDKIFLRFVCEVHREGKICIFIGLSATTFAPWTRPKNYFSGQKRFFDSFISIPEERGGSLSHWNFKKSKEEYFFHFGVVVNHWRKTSFDIYNLKSGEKGRYMQISR